MPDSEEEATGRTAGANACARGCDRQCSRGGDSHCAVRRGGLVMLLNLLAMQANHRGGAACGGRGGGLWARRQSTVNCLNPLSRFTASAVLIGSVLLVPIPRLSAQERRPVPTVVAAEGPPDAPEPQPMAFSAQSSGEQSAEGESNGVSVVVEEPLSNAGQPHSVPDPLAADISGTVTDVYGDIVPGATVIFEGNDAGDRRTAVAGDNAAFKFDNLTPGTPYHITIEAKNFESWKSPTIVLVPGQYLFLKDIKLKLPDAVTSVIVYASEEHIATEQVRMEERQRVLGVIPNFYVTYDPHPVALTTKLKFRLAYKASTDPMTFVGLAFMADRKSVV